MLTPKKVTRTLYKLAKISNDFDTILTGNPRKMLQRLYNKRMGKHVSSKINSKGKK